MRRRPQRGSSNTASSEASRSIIGRARRTRELERAVQLSLRRSARLLEGIAAERSGPQGIINTFGQTVASTQAFQDPASSLGQFQYQARTSGEEQEDNQVPALSGLNGENRRRFKMHVIIEPPQQVRPGRILNPPIVVRLDKTEAEDESVTDPSLLFAFISITSEDGSTSLAPPRDDLIAGNLSDSVHTLDSDSESDEEEVGFLSFPNLRIQDPGNYRLRVSLMKMEVTDSSASTGAMNLQSTLSRVIHVNSEAEDLSPGEEEAALLENLQQRGLRTQPT
ncbi:MAG: hypothetical protein LQ340_000648 [Diploschistes diacapsis]|nr:MAG: hypothetical protein LQ340_000648 [Diploschistes diacapsis]